MVPERDTGPHLLMAWGAGDGFWTFEPVGGQAISLYYAGKFYRVCPYCHFPAELHTALREGEHGFYRARCPKPSEVTVDQMKARLSK